MKAKRSLGIVFLFTAALIWGTAFSAQKFAADAGIGSFYFNGTRFLIGAATLFPIVLVLFRFRIPWKGALLPSLVAGAVLFLASNLQQLALSAGSSVGTSSFITGMYIILVPIASFLLFRHNPSPTVWVGAVLSAVGLYFISITPGSDTLAIGDIYLLVSCLFWTAHILVIERMAADVPPLLFSMLQFFFSGLFSLAAAFLFEDVSFTALTLCWGPILYTGVFSSGVAYTCQVLGQRRVESSKASIILSAESLFGALSGVLINHESLSFRAALGAALIFSGIILSQLTLKKKQKA